jgi:hypothetical protein
MTSYVAPGPSIVDHPSHYTFGRFEVIDVLEDWGLNYHLGNVVKYVARADHKGTPLVDLRKAAWYLNREIERRVALLASPENPIEVEYKTSAWVPLRAQPADDIKQRVLTFLAASPEQAFTVRVIAKALEIPHRKRDNRYHCFTTVMSRLYRSGRVLRPRRGVYQAKT